MLVSLFVSFSLDPMLSAYWADPQVEAHERRNPIARTLDRFNQWFNRQAELAKLYIPRKESPNLSPGSMN